MTRYLLLVAAVAALGCSTPLSATLRHVSRGEFPPRGRDAAWDRAVAEYVDRNLGVALSDKAGGVLVSREVKNQVTCGDDAACTSTEVYELALCSDGTALLRVNRFVWGMVQFGSDTELVTEVQRRALLDEQDALLARIIGAPYPPPPPPPGVQP
jgi:hypothetical protein